LEHANTLSVTTPAPVIEGATAAQDAARDWQAVHGDPTIQFSPVQVDMTPPPPPGWLKAVGNVLKAVLEPIGQALGFSWPVLMWVLIGLTAVLVAYGLFRMFEPAFAARNTKAPKGAAIDEWVPDEHEALALLEDADRLAAEGRYDEATHLLLRRSVQQIVKIRPGWVQRASTAREISVLPGLSDGARSTFALIAERVERSLFALRQLGADDWLAAREAYARFALERIAA
jgi:hypothetical protein